MNDDIILFERLQTAVDAAGVGTWDYNLVADTLEWSNRCKEIFGLPPTATVTYQDFLELLYPPDLPATEAAVASALDPAGPGTYDIEYRTRDRATGHPLLWARATGRAFFDSERTRVLRFIGTITDITSQKNMQEQLQESYRELEQKIVFRTLELEREVLDLRARVAASAQGS